MQHQASLHWQRHCCANSTSAELLMESEGCTTLQDYRRAYFSSEQNHQVEKHEQVNNQEKERKCPARNGQRQSTKTS